MDQQSRPLLIKDGGQALEGAVGVLPHKLPLSPEYPPGGPQVLELIAPVGHLIHRHHPLVLNHIGAGVVGPHKILVAHGAQSHAIPPQ